MKEKQLAWNWLSQYDELVEEDFEAIDEPEEIINRNDVHFVEEDDENEQIK